VFMENKSPAGGPCACACAAEGRGNVVIHRGIDQFQVDDNGHVGLQAAQAGNTENAVSPLLLRARAQLGRIPNV
jgi:hypothetical protein